MAGSGRIAGARRRRAQALAAAAVVHALALLALGWSVDPRTRPPAPVDQPTVELSLVRLAAPAPELRQAAAPPAPTRPARPRPPAPASPALPSPAPLALPRPAGVAARGNAAPPPAETGDLRGFLRATVGCDHADYMRLAPAERARCDAGYGVAAHTGERLDMIPLEKRAAFSRQALADARKRTQREVALPNSPVVACTGAGSNFGLGCLPPEAIHGLRP